ncbi:MAG: fimbrillin family protein [Prevotellaceae bacterium]|nr:fimbrillin family protein [Candidatus Minthosoma equi]
MIKSFRYILSILAAMLFVTSCTDEDLAGGGNGTTEDYYGEMVHFAAGTTVNSVSTRADGGNSGNNYSETPGQTYYMPDAYRFVCRMYYKAATGENPEYDVSGKTDVTTWLKVKGDVGHSLYWSSDYPVLNENDKSLFDNYGNDIKATCFYWQNRKEHAFLAWTDLNKATTFTATSTPVPLKMETTFEYEEHTGEKQKQYVSDGYRLYGVDDAQKLTSVTAAINYGVEHYDEIKDLPGQKDVVSLLDWSLVNSEYFDQYTNSMYLTYIKSLYKEFDQVYDKDNHMIKYKWGGYIGLKWSDDQRLEYTLQTDDVVASTPDANDKIWVKNSSGTIVARKLGENRYCAVDGTRNHDDLYDITQEPAYKVAFYVPYEEKVAEIINKYKAQKFDIARGNYGSINEMPDIVQALKKMKPEGATQEANRVNLKFTHQFSQVQVNVRTSSDLSVVIEKEQIQKVELLGVSDEAYVFTELNKDGNVKATTYKSVDISKYDDEQLKRNQYGSSFEMFPMAEPSSGYIKSFNALTFGQLRAIRITWNEEPNGTGISHESTYHIADEDLKNLKSGYKYVWNIELRRGTLAIVRTEIVDWSVGKEYNISGTIIN